MYVIVRDRLGKPQRLPCTSLVLYTDEHAPVAAAREHSASTIQAANYQDTDFPRVLELCENGSRVSGA